MHFVTGAAMWHHLCLDMEVCTTNETQQDMDHLGALWFATSVPFLFAHFQSQLTELVIELTTLVGLTLLVVWQLDDDLYYSSIYCASVVLVVVAGSWIVNKGPPRMRLPWVITGAVLLVAGAVLFFVAGHGDNWVHGSWHVTGALGATFVIYGARDPTYMPDYHLMSDVFLNQP